MKNNRLLITIIIILSLLICILGAKIYFDIQKRNDIKFDENFQSTNQNPNESNKLDISLLANNIFVIDKIEHKDGKYELTAYLLEDDSRIFSKEECDNIKSGKNFIFRNASWKYVADSVMGNIITQTNNDAIRLKLTSDNTNETCYLENITGIKSPPLRDYSDKKIIFEVDNNLLIGTSNARVEKDEKDNLKVVSEEGEVSKETLPTLIEYQKYMNSGALAGSYGECTAIIINKKVVAINTNFK